MIRLLTGNELVTGDVVWWTGTDWSRRLADASDAGPDAEALLERVRAEERINDAALVDAEATPDGPRPRTMRERIRGMGPTIPLVTDRVAQRVFG